MKELFEEFIRERRYLRNLSEKTPSPQLDFPPPPWSVESHKTVLRRYYGQIAKSLQQSPHRNILIKRLCAGRTWAASQSPSCLLVLTV
jgi:hypothetical protein